MGRTTVDSQLARIRAQVEALKAKEKSLLAKANSKVIEQIVALVAKHNVTIEELTQAISKSKTVFKPKTPKTAKRSSDKRAKVAPKYRNPNDASQTWTGRGRTPIWAQALKDAGTFDSALIASV